MAETIDLKVHQEIVANDKMIHERTVQGAGRLQTVKFLMGLWMVVMIITSVTILHVTFDVLGVKDLSAPAMYVTWCSQLTGWVIVSVIFIAWIRYVNTH
jgi:hypothetical protein